MKRYKNKRNMRRIGASYRWVSNTLKRGKIGRLLKRAGLPSR